jgi:hypothetical protein
MKKYIEKYLKYKQKYLNLKGGSGFCFRSDLHDKIISFLNSNTSTEFFLKDGRKLGTFLRFNSDGMDMNIIFSESDITLYTDETLELYCNSNTVTVI